MSRQEMVCGMSMWDMPDLIQHYLCASVVFWMGELASVPPLKDLSIVGWKAAEVLRNQSLFPKATYQALLPGSSF